ncbi:Ulp1 peptidase [Purpureocillium takamizusanense]|uniref:Ulp1 peptidase n=1 Tax=Purpureocillium takamizusanense TaxID=2060973 RepID=A0A9Q8VBG6_9HYPO|nr:Ulp1 peptidase [Purpureocillium takamizusanense]UNI18874.1 Ulp1 peptidase [Purpureocillium takamizusanense]
MRSIRTRTMGTFTIGTHNHQDKPTNAIDRSKEERMTSKRLVLHPFAFTADLVAKTLQRSINGQTGPLNTFNRQAPSDPFGWDTPSPPNKRQRQDVTDFTVTLTRKIPASNTRRSQAHVEDLTKTSSHDGHDSNSISSAGKLPGRSVALPEYRNAQIFGQSTKRRQRKSRQSLSQTSSRGKAHDTMTPNKLGKHSDMHSPDILSIEDDPAHAKIASDLLPSRKTVRQHLAIDRSGPPVKRAAAAKAILEPIHCSDESPDDLSNDKEPVQFLVKKPTNFDAVASPPSQRRTAGRGDIQPTTFQKPQRPMGSSQAPLPDMVLNRAICGKAFYKCEGQPHSAIRLVQDRQDSRRLVPVTDSGKCDAQPWLTINMGTVQKIYHASTHSACVMVERPANNLHTGKAFLEFTTPQGAMAFIRLAPKDLVVEHELEWVESRVKHALGTAETYRESCPRDQEESVLMHDQAPWVSKPVLVGDGGGSATSGPKSDSEPQRLTRSRGPPATLDVDDPSSHSTKIGTRRTRRTSPRRTFREPTPERWTANNPGWRERWQRSLVYPATGKNRATVDDEDIPRLDEGEFLNDNLISFYIRYLQVTLERESPEVLKKVHIFSTFFFEKLRSTKGKINYDGVKAWTAKIDLFSYDYIIVPVNEHAHWYLAIVCNVPNAISGVPDDDDVEMIDARRKSQDRDPQSTPPPPSSRTLQSSPSGKKLDPRQPRIVTLDSLESPHSPTCRALKEYLIEEARDKRNVELAVVPSGMSAKKIPCQNNYCDCGVYVLGYLREFLRDPDETARKLLQREDLGWDIQPSQLRDNVRELLFGLQDDQSKRLEHEKQEKRATLARKKAAKKGQHGEQNAAQADDPPAVEAPLPTSSSAESMTSGVATAKSRQSPDTEFKTASARCDRTPGGGVTIEDEPALIDRLSNSSTSSGNSSAFYSAQESPDGMPPSVAKVPKATAVENDKGPRPSSHGVVDVDDDVQLVQPLSSSSEGKGHAHEVRERRLKRKQPMQTYGGDSRGKKQTSRFSGYFKNSASSSVKGGSTRVRREGYDGIDPVSVDLTQDT